MLMQLSRQKVTDDGYVYKHGKSRSKFVVRAETTDESSTSSGSGEKNIRTSERERLDRISYVMENISENNRRIEIKEK